MGAAVGNSSLVPAPFDLDEKDRFGLPLHYSLLCESDEERSARIEATTQLILDTFESAVRQLGSDHARDLFAEAAKRPPLGKQADREKNEELLAIYDQESQRIDDVRQLPGRIAKQLDARNPGRYGASAPSIEKQLRRLIKNRNKKWAEEEEKIRNYQAFIAGIAGRTFTS